MSICDKVTDADLELAVSALRRLTDALDRAGLDAARHLTQAETEACVKLSGLCPAGPVAVNGDEEAQA